MRYDREGHMRYDMMISIKVLAESGELTIEISSMILA